MPPPWARRSVGEWQADTMHGHGTFVYGSSGGAQPPIRRPRHPSPSPGGFLFAVGIYLVVDQLPTLVDNEANCRTLKLEFQGNRTIRIPREEKCSVLPPSVVGGDQYTGMWERGKMAGHGSWVRPHRWRNQYTHTHT